MHGFSQRSEVATVLAWIDAHAARLGSERIGLEAACGRVLARPVTASLDVPAFDRSAMDGYAVRSVDTSGAGDYNPLTFAIVGQALPGQPFAGDAVGPSRAVRVMTGAPIKIGRASCRERV